ncbi:hypothetical protein [Candidatus Leptofilum sp.]|uniref:hypothetical protein n=1 Tax=Candidatus Leptofilum sp. TaxID=3241576 RepID=UPI003B5BBFB1
MKKRFVFFVLVTINLWWLAACGGSPAPVPEPTNTAVAEAIPPTETATDAPPTATPTAEIIPTEPEPTEEALFPTPEVTPTPTLTPTVATPDYNLTIVEPAPATTLLAGRDVTFRGEVQPPTTDPISLTLTIGSFTAVSTQITPADDGRWELTTTLANAASGPGLLSVSLGDLAQAQQTNPIAFDSSTDEPYISLVQPVEGETAVAGYTFFMQGDSRNLIDDAFTIGVLVDDCTNFIAAQKISLSGGLWYGFVILPQNAVAGPACAVAYTGEYGEGAWRETIIPIQLRAYDDPQAVLLKLGNLGELTFNAGQATNLFGVAANVPEGAVDIMLELDSVGGNGRLVTSGKAFADQFGFWAIDLDVPDDAPSGPALLTISTGEGESYQEIRLPVTISP